MQYTFNEHVVAELQKILRNHPKLSKKIEKQLTIFKQNHRHPSLRTHKLQGKLGESWSISIDRSFRMIYRIIENEKGKQASFYDIGTHDEVYGKS